MNKIFLSLLFGLLGYFGSFYLFTLSYGQILICCNWVIVIPLLLLFLVYRDKKNYLSAFSIVSLSLNNLIYLVFSTMLYHANRDLFTFSLLSGKGIAIRFIHHFVMQYLTITTVELLLNRSIFRDDYQSHHKKIHSVVRKVEEGFLVLILLLFLAAITGLVTAENKGVPFLYHRPERILLFVILMTLLSVFIAKEVYRNAGIWNKRISYYFNSVGSRYFSLFENLNAVYYESTFDGTILEISDGIKELYGYCAEELKGQQLINFYEEPDDRNNMIDRLLIEGEIKDYEIKLRDKDGQTHSALIHAKIDAGIDGVHRIIGVVRDITKEKLNEYKQKSAEEKYSNIFHNLIDVYYEMNCYGELLEISPSVETTLGYSREELLGVNALSLCARNFAVEREFKRIFNNKTTSNREVTIISKSGEHRLFLVSMTFVADTGAQQKISGIARDITEFMKMKLLREESENRYKSLFENTLNGVIILEPIYDLQENISEVRFLECNPSFERITGLHADSTVGKTWYEIFGYQNRYLEVYKNVLQTGIPKRDENYNPVLKKLFKIEIFRLSENLIGGVFEDITKQKLYEQELLELNKVLEERVEERTLSLQMAMRDQEAFSFSVSHDLKSPLRIINIYSKLFMEEYGTKQQEKALEMITRIQERSEDMISMVNKLLLYVKDSKQEMVYCEVDMKELIRVTFQELILTVPKRNIRLEMSDEIPPIKGDSMLLKRIVDNILSNAIKYTRIRGEAIIKVNATFQEAEVVYSFSDNGIGMDMQESGKIFGMFQRLSTEAIYEGTGIGMAVILKLVQRHKGRVWIQGESDEGATIYIALPIVKEETT